MEEVELYDRQADPAEQVNVAAEHPDVVADLLAETERWQEWARSQKVEPGDEGDLSAEELRQLKSLGYL